MTLEQKTQLLKLMGYKVVPFTDEMRAALKKGQVVCPAGNDCCITHLEVDVCSRNVMCGLSDTGKIRVQSEFFCEGDGEAIHLHCSCGACLNASWFVPSDIEMDYL